MKKSALLMAFFGLTYSTLAQISITQYDMPQADDVYLYYLDAGLVSADFTQTGANQTWDYSQSGATTNDTLTMSTVTSTPLAYQLYFNNSILYPQHKANYAIQAPDFNGFGQITIENRYDFYKKNAGSLEIVGFGANINTIPASVRYDTIDKIYHFPMQYLDVDHSVGYFITTIPTLGTYGSHINRTIEVDGWGSLTTPSKTYPNALRVKTTLMIKDTVFVDQFSFGTVVNRPVEIRYEWWTNEDHTPVMVATSNAGQITQVKYLTPITSTIVENESSPFKIIPTSNALDFQIIGNEVSSIQEVMCYDLSGKVVPFKYDNTSKMIYFDEYIKGMLLITVQVNGQQYTYKINK